MSNSNVAFIRVPWSSIKALPSEILESIKQVGILSPKRVGRTMFFYSQYSNVGTVVTDRGRIPQVMRDNFMQNFKRHHRGDIQALEIAVGSTIKVEFGMQIKDF